MDISHFRIHTMKDVAPLKFKEAKIIYQKTKNKKDFSQFLYYLRKNGYVKIKNMEGGKAIILEKKGFKKILSTKFKNFKLKDKKRKDGKCIMLIFDIPENRRILRDLLREVLYNLGYKMLQQSVWICVYEVEKETKFFLQQNDLDKYIKMFLIEEQKI